MTTRRTRKKTSGTSDVKRETEVMAPSIEPIKSAEQEAPLEIAMKEEGNEPEISSPEEPSAPENIPSVDKYPINEVATSTDKDDEKPQDEKAPIQERSISTGFGWVVIDGSKYEHDVVILTDGSVTKRRKDLSRDKKSKYGHTPLTRKELLPLLEHNPDLIVIGTGQSGAMPITPKAEALLNEHACFIGPTPDAIEWIEKDDRKLIALLHVTC